MVREFKVQNNEIVKGRIVQSERDDIRTVTMARIYARQGHYSKAAAIYRYLLQQTPERRDLVDALQVLEKKMNSGAAGHAPVLTTLVSEWVGLLLRYRQLLDLEALQRLVASKKSLTFD